MDKPKERAVTVRDFAEHKRKGEKIVVMTAYDALFGRLVDESGVDAILVGDSLGTAIMGYSSTLPVTLDHMIYHAAAVKRGAKRALVIIDMPFLSYQASIESAVLNCGRAIQETGVGAVKVEGGSPEMLDTVHALVRTGIPVMAHIGFTPQSVNTIGGARVQGREAEGAERLINEAKGLEQAGAFAVVLELVPATVSASITKAIGIPTIGIGAGVSCDGQVLVLPDVLGLNDEFNPKFLKRYAEMAKDVRAAIGSWASDVRSGAYPDAAHSF
ncbi:MAG TPA: 3-methyl-2-oxobutanoate hydroxymethyltransferase [Gemmatimonadaceae bacterium]|nr:3-methyl-2-oxobutanoate hydroxymethyltransferase [Gemmatimonadaceae bacterium]